MPPKLLRRREAPGGHPSLKQIVIQNAGHRRPSPSNARALHAALSPDSTAILPPSFPRPSDYDLVCCFSIIGKMSGQSLNFEGGRKQQPGRDDGAEWPAGFGTYLRDKWRLRATPGTGDAVLTEGRLGGGAPSHARIALHLLLPVFPQNIRSERPIKRDFRSPTVLN